MGKHKKKLKEAECRKAGKGMNQSVSQAAINNNSTRETFLKWLNECGRDLGTYEYSKKEIVLSCSSSDGPTIKEDTVGGVPYNKPEALDKWLEDEGLYEPFESEFVDYINPPSMRYIDWFNHKYKKEKG